MAMIERSDLLEARRHLRRQVAGVLAGGPDTVADSTSPGAGRWSTQAVRASEWRGVVLALALSALLLVWAPVRDVVLPAVVGTSASDGGVAKVSGRSVGSAVAVSPGGPSLGP